MIFLIDHYDSFVHNLARYFELLGCETTVQRYRDDIICDIDANRVSGIVLSPGPKAPQDVPHSIEVVRQFSGRIPILGVCLGHQCIAEAYGGKTAQSATPVHGESSDITHSSQGLFEGLPPSFRVGRYHSLVCSLTGASDLTVTAQNAAQIIMGMQHKTLPVYGVQFHPESILTEHGLDLLRNFVNITTDYKPSETSLMERKL